MLYARKAYLAPVNRLPYQAMWDQDTQDAEGATVAFSEQQYTNAVNKKVNSMLVLSHEPYGIVHAFSSVLQMLNVSTSCQQLQLRKDYIAIHVWTALLNYELQADKFCLLRSSSFSRTGTRSAQDIGRGYLDF